MGSDYRKAHRSILGGSSGNALGPGATRYVNPNGSDFVVAPDANMRIPFACHIRNFYVRCHAPPGVGETFTYTLMVEGIASLMTAQIAGAVDVEANDLVNSIALALGDDVSLRLVTSAGAAQVLHNFSFEIIG